jgi:glucuronoarabinoxylan endo-1,4-beta-xylanase
VSQLGGCLIHLDLEKKTWTADKRLYTLGNYSRFVRPGYFRVNIEADPASGVLISAYKNEPTRQLVVVAINENEGSQDLELRLAGASASVATPYRTSETEDLAALPELRIPDNTLKAALAPGSVTTFVATVTAK